MPVPPEVDPGGVVGGGVEPPPDVVPPGLVVEPPGVPLPDEEPELLPLGVGAGAGVPDCGGGGGAVVVGGGDDGAPGVDVPCFPEPLSCGG